MHEATSCACNPSNLALPKTRNNGRLVEIMTTRVKVRILKEGGET